MQPGYQLFLLFSTMFSKASTFLLFPPRFQKGCTVDTYKPGLVWERFYEHAVVIAFWNLKNMLVNEKSMVLPSFSPFPTMFPFQKASLLTRLWYKKRKTTWFFAYGPKILKWTSFGQGRSNWCRILSPSWLLEIPHLTQGNLYAPCFMIRRFDAYAKVRIDRG